MVSEFGNVDACEAVSEPVFNLYATYPVQIL